MTDEQNSPLYIVFLFSCPLCCCSDRDAAAHDDMVGVWVLKNIIFPTGYEVAYLNARGYTRCKIYDNDSTYYAELFSVDNETMILPLEFDRYTFIYNDEES